AAQIGPGPAAGKAAVGAQPQDFLLAQLPDFAAEMPARQVEEGRLDELVGPERRRAGIGRTIAATRFGAHQTIEKGLKPRLIGGGERRVGGGLPRRAP